MKPWILHLFFWSLGAASSIVGTLIVTDIGNDSGFAASNGRSWMHERGVHPSHVSCSRDDIDDDSDVLCVFFVPNEGAETVQIFECTTVAYGLCHEPWE